ncbi:Xre family transcriptional regulator [Hasllibacter halocynthiae]|uniref:Xre family transcriptional regulator n=1 Tax=Hasllibacter halocynthiae TaxID=595589 RepID=A0A2T0X9S5_9RHOB|nr:helix-turn-helix transcriptional regulator [Hasllibacter halocynthiae]PRY95679.1 Xre family transcriptional regulator [Hasllibacter halocynthiae]
MTETPAPEADPTDWYAEDRATFGDRLALAREAAGLSQRELATRLGVRPSALAKWEDDLDEPRANRLTFLSGMLGVSIRWLLTGTGEGPAADDAIPANMAGALGELRALRAQCLAQAERIARVEKRLRAGLADD